MKHISLFNLFVLCTVTCITAMESPASLTLTQEEQAAYNWFSGYQSKLSFFSLLSQEDKDVINKKVKYQDNPAAVTELNKNYIKAFYKVAQLDQIELKYPSEILESASLKIMRRMHSNSLEEVIDLPSARRRAWKELSEKEQDTYRPINYEKNPEAAHQVASKWSKNVAALLVPIRLIEDTEEAKAKKAQELYDDQLARFKSHYK